MAKAAKKFVTLKALPKKLPDGLEIVQAKKTLKSFDAEGNPVLVAKLDDKGNETKDKDGKTVQTQKTEDVIVDFLVNRADNAGVIAYQKFYADSGMTDEIVAAALRDTIISGVTARLTLETAKDSTRILPPAPEVRLVDRVEAIGEQYKAKLLADAKSGKVKSQAEVFAEYQEMMKALGVSAA